MFDGMEFGEASEDNDGTRLSIISGPAAEAGEDQEAKARDPLGCGFSGGLEGEPLRDVGFAVLDHGRADRAGLAKPSRASSPVEPTPALFILEVPLFVRRALSRAAIEVNQVDKAEGESADRVNRDQRMGRKTKAALIPPNRGRVLDRKRLPAGTLGEGPRRRRLCDFRGRHPPIVQEAADPHLARPIAAELANARPRTAARPRPGVQKHPPFSRRASPNRPSPAPSPRPSPIRPRESELHPPRKRFEMCEYRRITVRESR